MARLRKFVAYRNLERPYTRKSKYRSKNYVRAYPNLIVARWEMGNVNGNFDTKIELVAKESLHIRHNAMESCRQTANRVLEAKLGKTNYFFKIRMYPFHVLRENPLASGAGADRMSTGMQKAFGKPIGAAAQIKPGKTILEIRLAKKDTATGKLALKRASYKLPGGYTIKTTTKTSPQPKKLPHQENDASPQQ